MTNRKTNDATLREANTFVRSRLSDKRYAHTIRVADTAERLAALHGFDAARTRLAALLHDVAREVETDEYLQLAEKWQISVGEPERENPKLLHGPVAAELARRELGVMDDDVLEAIRFHTTGAPGMGLVALAVYVADKIEPSRDYPSVERLRKLAESDLKEAAAEALRRTIAHNEERARKTHPASRETLRWIESAGDYNASQDLKNR